MKELIHFRYMHFNDHLVGLSIKSFVFNEDGKFLTLLRTETAPTRPLTWDLPGGVYERGEVPEECAKREIREETGLEATEFKLLTLKNAQNDRGEDLIRVAYRARALSSNVTLSFEHKEYRWVTKEEFLELESASTWKEIATEYLTDE